MKCFITISYDEDHINLKLQQDIDSIVHQISLSHLTIRYAKCVHVPFKLASNTRYLISNTEITCQNTNKDLGVIVSSDLKWSNHYNFIIPKAYKSLRRTFSSMHCPSVRLHLYITLVCRHLTYCSKLWRPYMIKDIISFECIQRRATKYILNFTCVVYHRYLWSHCFGFTQFQWITAVDAVLVLRILLTVW